MSTEVLMAFVSLLGVIGLIFLTYFGTRWMSKKFHIGGFNGSAGKGIKVIECTGITPDKQLMIVSVGKKHMLLGITSTSISKICDLDDGDLEVFQVSPIKETESSFLNNLKKAFAENVRGDSKSDSLSKSNKSNSIDSKNNINSIYGNINRDTERDSKTANSEKDGRDLRDDF